MKYEIRALGVGEVLDHAISLTQDNLWLFAKIILVLLLPFTLVSNFVINTNAARNQARVELRSEPQIGPAEEDHVVLSRVPATGQPTVDLTALAPVVIVALLQLLIVYPLSNAAIIYGIGNCYLDQPISVGTAYRRAVRVYLPLLATAILTSMAVGAGYLLCFVPGVIFALWFSLSSQVVVLEGVLAAAAMGRSRQLGARKHADRVSAVDRDDGNLYIHRLHSESRAPSPIGLGARGGAGDRRIRLLLRGLGGFLFFLPRQGRAFRSGDVGRRRQHRRRWCRPGATPSPAG